MLPAAVVVTIELPHLSLLNIVFKSFPIRAIGVFLYRTALGAPEPVAVPVEGGGGPLAVAALAVIPESTAAGHTIAPAAVALAVLVAVSKDADVLQLASAEAFRTGSCSV
jgi:hypothetical protein